MNELWIVVIPPAITGLCTVLAAWVVRGPRTADRQSRDWSRVVAVTGLTLTVVLGTGMLAWLQIGVSYRESEWRALDNPTLDQLPQSSAGISATQHRPDLDANAVLNGAGVRQWPLSDGTSIVIDQVFYVDEWQWVDEVFPDGEREDSNATCGIRPPGTLVVRGFSVERSAALVEYSIQGDTFGTPCDTGTYFFYGLPQLP